MAHNFIDKSRLVRQTQETKGPSVGETYDMLHPHHVPDPLSQVTLNPSKQASAFTRSYEVKHETFSSNQEGDSKRQVIGSTKVEIVPGDSTENPKHVYVNISTRNSNTDIGIPAQYNIDFDQPILKDAEKYYLTIAKATFPTTSIPLFQFIPNTYYVTLGFNGITPSFYTTYLKPIDIVESTPGVYYVYYYQQFINSLNVALLESFNELVSNQSSFAGTVPPYFVYDKPTNRFSLISQSGIWYPEAEGASASFIYLDYSTYRLFNSIQGVAATGLNGSNVILLEPENTGSVSGNSIVSNGVNPLFTGNMASIYYSYDPSVNYKRGSIILYLPTTTYYAAIVDNVGLLPPTNPATWQVQGTTEGLESIWQVGTTYVQSQIVYYPTANSVPFISLQYPNIGNTPVPGTTTAFWKPIGAGLPTTWSPLITYEIGQNVYYPNINSGNIYTSTSNGNISHPPSTDLTGANWLINTTFISNNFIGEYSTLQQWQDIEAIVIQSGTLPIRYEVFSPPEGDSDGGPSSSSASGSQVPRPVLTDLDLIRTADGFDRSPVQYVPNGPYRMIDLLSKPEIKRIDAYIQYKHKDLTFSDLILLPGDYFAIKYLFIRNDALSLT